jgi:hypothetical protein
MRRSPSGVAMGVSGEAQTLRQAQSVIQVQTPSRHATENPHVPWQALATQVVADGSEHVVPALGICDGHDSGSTGGAMQLGAPFDAQLQ